MRDHNQELVPSTVADQAAVYYDQWIQLMWSLNCENDQVTRGEHQVSDTVIAIPIGFKEFHNQEFWDVF